MLKTMYPAQVNSRQTELASGVDAVQTNIPLIDANIVPEAPNMVTIGTDESAETILYTGKTGNNLTGVTRGFQGTATSWAEGSKVARYFTAYDSDTMRDNILQLGDKANKRWADVKDYGAKGDGSTDDTTSIRNAISYLELTGGGLLLLPIGIYLVSDTLYIPSNVTVLGIGKSVLKRNSDVNALVITKSDGVTGGYEACENITIENVIFDGSQSQFQPNCTLFASGHAKNILIKNCTFRNLDGWHMVELNATKDSKVVGCTFENYGYGDTTNTITEMLQLDFSLSSVSFPWYGPYDLTSCNNIAIENNIFRKSRWRAIGNHTYQSGVVLQNIYIKGNVFDSVVDRAIELDDVDGLNITGNTFSNTANGVLIVNQKNNNKNILIEGNHYYGTKVDPYVLAEGRFVGINPSGRNGLHTINVKILNNTIVNANTHGIGVTANDVLIQGNRITSSHSNGIYFYGGDGGVISHNMIYGNYTSQQAGRADIVIGNSAADATTFVIVTGNRIGTLIAGTNISDVFVHGNNITSVVSGTAIVKNNVINSVFTS